MIPDINLNLKLAENEIEKNNERTFTQFLYRESMLRRCKDVEYIKRQTGGFWKKGRLKYKA